MATSLFTVQMRKPQSIKRSKPAWLAGTWPKSWGYEAAAEVAHPSTTKQSSLSAQRGETRSPTQQRTLGTSPGLPQNLSGLWAHGSGALGLKEALDP